MKFFIQSMQANKYYIGERVIWNVIVLALISNRIITNMPYTTDIFLGW